MPGMRGVGVDATQTPAERSFDRSVNGARGRGAAVPGAGRVLITVVTVMWTLSTFAAGDFRVAVQIANDEVRFW